MRVEKKEQIVLTTNEYKVLDEIWDKLENLKIEDDDMVIVRNTLQEAITNFFENCSDDLE
jgi:hypothetical protein